MSELAMSTTCSSNPFVLPVMQDFEISDVFLHGTGLSCSETRILYGIVTFLVLFWKVLP
jgi:hypothetical protein